MTRSSREVSAIRGSFDVEKATKGGLSENKAMLVGVLLTLGAIAGLASSTLPVKIIIPVVMGAILFVLIYRDLQLGIILFLIFNLLLPQAGPNLDLGIQTPVGERGLHFCIHEIIIAMVLLAWLIQVFQKKKDWRAKSPLMWPVIIYILANIFSYMVGMVHGAMLLIVVFRFVRTTLFVYIFFVVLNNVTTRKQLKQLVVISLICATIVAGFGIMQWVLGQAWSEQFNKDVLDKIGYPKNINYVAGEAAGKVYRVNSTFAHPNVLGGYLVFFLPFLISLLWCWKTPSARLLLLIAIMINLVCLYVTGSRAAWIAAAVIAILYIFFGLLDRRMVLAFAIVALLVIMVVVLINPPQYVQDRLTGYAANISNKSKIYQYRMGTNLFLERPIFGLGEGTVGLKLKMGNFRETWTAVENIFLYYLVSEGIVGLITYLLVWAFFWGMLISVWRRKRGDPFLRYTSEGLILGMVGTAISSLFGAWLLFAIPMLTLWWFYLGLGASLYNVSLEPETELVAEPARRGGWYSPRPARVPF
jgi:O-Antigen ligase